ncbi:filamentous hemagglutinin family protein [Mesorhizobium soli]|uniref:beta strand repeat-containing protein n=1 Tax=Pseudaminobacter soli (ex Li et al. 2025) TaxID=1295366 RepID=UPI002474709C|nr:YDG domain-containing protein [Mesorhizobium soli]MDH6232250.1 filamentous hemagglutinin family protein [Mesorhizobium soli]
MNRVYRHFWLSNRRSLATALASATMLSSPVLAQSVLPTGGQIVSGSGTITTNGNAMTINQSTDRMIANWQSFSIGAGNSVTFNQPGASSVALNRVVGQDPSQILGSLTANGQVFLVNPNGIVVGKDASVQAGGFVGSTLGISDGDFLAGNYRFTGSGGSIVNQGAITGNVVALIAPKVSNEGTITGSAGLAAGTDVLLDFTGDGLLSVEVKGSTVEALVENKGLIKADGGVAILTAKGASAAKKGVVNNSGTIEAKTIAKKKGRILLLGGMDNGEVKVSGRLDASAPNGGDGGFIETSASKVKIADSAQITTKATGGTTGTWLIDPNDYTIAASGGDISAATLSGMLGSTNVTIQSASGSKAGNGDIFVNDSVTWAANTLTLNAYRNIVINSAIYASGAAGLSLQYGLGAVAAGNTATYTVNAPINLASSGTFSTKLGSDGTVKNYTIITDVNALQNMNNGLGGNYVLGSNIDASDTANWNSGAGFVPIGSSNTGFFTGIFDGLGHVITDLTVKRNSLVGLFGYANGATFRNVGLVRNTMNGSDHVGGLVGYVQNSTITNSYSTGTVSGQIYVGGLVGLSYLTTIDHAYAAGTVSGNYYIGGLVGKSQNSTINDAYASGWTIGTSDNIGGLVGWSTATAISNSSATGAVSGGDSVGGLVGWNSGGTIASSYAASSVTGGDATGGLVGWNRDGGGVSNSYATGTVNGSGYAGGLVGRNEFSTISNSYASGRVTSGAGGGLAGYNGSSSGITASFYGSETTGQSAACGANSGTCSATGLTTAQMNNPFNFIDAGWDFSSVWGTSKAGGAPLLRSLASAPLYDYYVRLSGNLSRVYGDGNPSLGGVALDGVAAGNVSLSWGSAINASANAGTYAWSAPSVLSLTYSTGSAGDYYVDYGTGGLTIAKRVVSIAGSRTYNGSTGLDSSIFSLTNLSNGETLTLSGTGSMADKNAGTGKAVSLDTLALGNGTGLASNYTLVGGSNTVDIGKAVISAITGITAANKTYDGTAGATLDTSGAGFSGMIAGDSLAVATGTGTFGDKNAGTGKTVGISGLTLGGVDALNYALASTTATTTATIAKAALSISGFTVANKIYDGNTTATITNAGTLSGVVSGENVSFTYGSASFSDKNAGAGKTVTLGGIALTGVDMGNYTIAATGTTTADITKAVISSITGITAANRTYDGTTVATLDASDAGFSGIISGDDLMVASATGTFADKNAGSGKAVNINGLSLGGVDAGNYTLADTTAATTADIAKAVISAITGITAADKTYDGTIAATLDMSGVGFTGMVAGDNLEVARATGAFSDKNAGLGKTINIAGLSLGGADAGNYALADTTAATTADITKATISAITGITAGNKTYDGTTAVVLDTSAAGFSGMIAGDSLTVANAMGAFADKNAGTGKTVDVSGLTLDGSDAGNYALADTTAATTADIAKATLTLSGFTAGNKTYDGTAAATITNAGTLSGIISGDSVSFTQGSATFTDKNAGTGKSVAVGDIALNGADSDNYTIAGTATATADISRAVISSITGITANDKIFDGTTGATLNNSGARFNGMIAGDQLGIASVFAAFDSAMPGYDKPVRITGLTLGGLDAGNYTLADTAAFASADVILGSFTPLFPDQIERTKVTGFASSTALLLNSPSVLNEVLDAQDQD